MKWMYNFPQRSKAAGLLMGVVLTILGCNYLEKQFFADINKSVTAIYQDRLIPAAELFHANDIMYKKRLILEKYLINPAQQDIRAVRQQLAVHNAQIDSIMRAYESSYLVDEESAGLQRFNQSVHQYNLLEEKYLSNSDALPLATYDQQLEPLFYTIHQDLVQLSSIQTSEGKALLNGSRTISSGAYLLRNLQTAIVVVIMVVTYALLLSSRSLVPKNFQRFHLN